MSDQCPICRNEVSECGKDRQTGGIAFDCPVCGKFVVPGAVIHLRTQLGDSVILRAVFSHYVRISQSTSEWPILSQETINYLLNRQLPNAAEQANNLVLWLGRNLRATGDLINMTYEQWMPILGALTRDGVIFIAKELKARGILNNELLPKSVRMTLTLDGWSKFEQLQHGDSESRSAFMAMQYGNDYLNSIYKDCFRPAVKQTGFDLQRLDEMPGTGLIDNRLRVEILTARFLLVDLTFSNDGAYWEAGYAEGLGKPVFYTCLEPFFKKEAPYQDAGGVHFDTDHQTIILWTPGNYGETSEKLKANIRATLPSEARMLDE